MSKKHAKTLKEFDANEKARMAAISRNAGENFRNVKLGRVAVPEKLARPLVPVAYTKSGEFEGRLNDASDCPAGCVVKWEEAAW